MRSFLTTLAALRPASLWVPSTVLPLPCVAFTRRTAVHGPGSSSLRRSGHFWSQSSSPLPTELRAFSSEIVTGQPPQMPSRQQSGPDEVLSWWFDSSSDGIPKFNAKLWFMGGVEADEFIKERFGSLVEEALVGGLQEWETTPKGALAKIVLLDQFTRNIFRKTPKAFAGDAPALQLAKNLLNSGDYAKLHPAERVSVILAHMHAEAVEDVEAARRLAVEALGSLPDDLTQQGLQKMFQSTIRSAEEHKEIVERFGRYPHRNDALGRPSTEEELEYLKTGGATFGQ